MPLLSVVLFNRDNRQSAGKITSVIHTPASSKMFCATEAKRDHYARHRAAMLKQSMQPLAFMADTNTILIDGEIGPNDGEISAKMVKAVLGVADRNKPLIIKIHSPGGAIFEGFAIHDALKAYDGPKKCIVENCAFSAASVVVCAFAKGEVAIQPNGYFLLHGTHSENESMTPEEAALLKDLDRRMTAIYSARTGKSQTVIAAMLAKESYMHADEAVAFGLADSVIRPVASKPLKIAAKVRPAQPSATSRWKAAVDSHVSRGMRRDRAIVAVDRSHPGLRQRMIAEANRR